MEDERRVAVGLQVADRLVGQPVGEVLALARRVDGLAEQVGRGAAAHVGVEVGRRQPAPAPGDVDVEAVVLGQRARARPGATCRCGPSCSRPPLAASAMVVVESGKLDSWSGGMSRCQLSTGRRAAEVLGDVERRRRLAGHERRARRRADGRGGVAVGEARSLGRHRVQARRLVELVAVGAQVVPAQVVGHDHDHVGRSASGRRRPGVGGRVRRHRLHDRVPLHAASRATRTRAAKRDGIGTGSGREAGPPLAEVAERGRALVARVLGRAGVPLELARAGSGRAPGACR